MLFVYKKGAFIQFNPGDGTGIVDEINDQCNSDNNSYPLLSKARRVNSALDRFFTLAFQADGRWNFDDLNQTTAPLQSINLVSGTEKYALDTFTFEIINILRVEALDSNGFGVVLQRLDRDMVGWESLPQFNNVAGIPYYYDLSGKYIYLYPKPSYNSTNGLSLYYNRNKVAFTSASTTTSPGIPSIFHEYICRYASLPYLIEFQKGQKNDVAAQIQLDEAAILDHFSHREKGIAQRIQTLYRSSR